MIKHGFTSSLILGLSLSAMAQDIPPAPEIMQNLEPEVAAPAVPSDNLDSTAAIPESKPVATKSVKKKKKKKSSTGLHDDSPDLQKEARLHQIYKSYNSQPTAAADWDRVVGNRASEVYKIQNGDTLSGLSKTLFGDMNFWPKLWSANTFEIENPHEIEPGMSVRFYPGTLSMAPSLQVESTVAAAPAPAPDTMTDADPVVKDKKSRPVGQIPSSLPGYRYKYLTKFSSEVNLKERVMSYESASLSLSYQLSDVPLVGSGYIKETEMGLGSASDYQYIFVVLPKKSTETHFTVYKNLEILKDPYSEKSVSILEAQGEIEVLEVVNPEENEYRAIVKRTIHPVQVGSVLVPGHIPGFVADSGIGSKGPEARVIGGQYSHSRTLFGDGALIFLNSGTAAGIREGAFYSVHANQRLRNENTTALVNDIQIATIKIVQATKDFSTAFVTSVTDFIRVGDHLGTLRAINATEEKDKQNSLDAGSTGAEPDLDLESSEGATEGNSLKESSETSTGSEDVLPEEQSSEQSPDVTPSNPDDEQKKKEEELELE